MSSFVATPSPIAGAFVRERPRREDSRGFLELLGDADEIAEQANWVQRHLIWTVRTQEPVVVQRPGATRPRQQVLKPLVGYLLLAERLFRAPEAPPPEPTLGPCPDTLAGATDVMVLASDLAGQQLEVQVATDPGVPEAAELTLDTLFAAQVLGWFRGGPCGMRWRSPSAGTGQSWPAWL